MQNAVSHLGPRWARVVAGTAMVAAWTAISAAPALADPPDTPPNCTGADFAGVTAGVASATSAYLFTHPDVNTVITDLEKLPRSESATRLVQYESNHPQVRSELAQIRQPLVDFESRCGYGTRNDLT